jgi:hypothetical protein
MVAPIGILARCWAVAALTVVSPAYAATMTADQMCQVIRQDVAAYLGTGHPCACPYSLTRRGGLCGDLSAWAKPNGKAPRCYFEDLDGTFPPNKAPHPTREQWPAPPPCDLSGLSIAASSDLAKPTHAPKRHRSVSPPHSD